MSYRVEPNYKYLAEHDWAKVEDNFVLVGVTDYAQKTLKDVVYIELPEVGDTFDFKEIFGSIESVKAVSDLICPVAGEVVEINTELEESPEKVNEDPYGTWLVKIKPLNLKKDLENLLDAQAYKKLLEEEG
ncbi:MAG: glycine cleavage system protein GcvH [Candidatus Heimdallarchaeota archaeon]|nr:glycine cleavage system protein GcvH [Candidatus Heimdallarchaeota archaeon]